MAELTLLDLVFDALRDRVIELGQPPYRANQVWQAVYRDLVASYGEMTTLPTRLRTELEERLPFGRLAPEATQKSPDRRTRKTLLRLADGEAIETVSMRYDDRRTVCVSTQVGCAMDCRICATGRGGFTRDLSAGEIVGQVLHAARDFRQEGQRLTNVVYMGMGEPFANYDVAWKRSSDERVNQFANVLGKRRIPVTIRVSRGVEIQAGCGQLRAEQVDTIG